MELVTPKKMMKLKFFLKKKDSEIELTPETTLNLKAEQAIKTVKKAAQEIRAKENLIY